MFVTDRSAARVAGVVRGRGAYVADARDAHEPDTFRTAKTSLNYLGIYVRGGRNVRTNKMVFDRVKEKISGGGSEEKGDDVVMPADSKIIKKTSKEVDLPRDETEEAVKKFQEVGAMAYPVIDKKAVRGDDKSSKAKEEGSPSFLYAVHENEKVLVVGGAKNILLSLADRLDMSNTETRAVTLAQRLAAERNGFSEHMVMDDVFMVPKEKRFASRFDGLEDVAGDEGSGAAETLRDKMDGVREVEENGFVLETPDRFEQALNLNGKKYFGVSYASNGRTIKLALDPKGRDDDHHSVIQPNGNIHIPREIAVGLGVEYRDVEWKMENGKIVGRMEDESMENEVADTVRTSLVEDNVNDMMRAHLSGSHTRTLNLEEGDEIAVYLEPDDDDFTLVATPLIYDAPTDAIVEVENIGTGTEMLCFAVPDEMAKVLEIDDGKDRQVEWGIRGEELVGSIVRL